jgi:hypothetical protein
MDSPDMIPIEVYCGQTVCLGTLGTVFFCVRLGILGSLGVEVCKVVFVQVDVRVGIFISKVDRACGMASGSARIAVVRCVVLFIGGLEKSLTTGVVRRGRRNAFFIL